VDVALDDGTINPSLSAFFNVVVFGIGHQVLANEFPRLWTEPFDILIQGGLLESLVENTDSAKPSERSGVGDMKGQIFIAEVEKLHHDCGTGYLLGAHTIGTGTVTFHLLKGSKNNRLVGSIARINSGTLTTTSCGGHCFALCVYKVYYPNSR
jgi:hypothetical protein